MTKTNLITGFLGSGKTTSILHLLANKDPAEKWAVLVNEFGEVGIECFKVRGLRGSSRGAYRGGREAERCQRDRGGIFGKSFHTAHANALALRVKRSALRLPVCDASHR